MTAPTRLLTIEEAAARLAVRPGLVRALCHSGKLAYTRVGAKLLRVSEAAVDAYIAEHSFPARQRQRT